MRYPCAFERNWLFDLVTVKWHDDKFPYDHLELFSNWTKNKQIWRRRRKKKQSLNLMSTSSMKKKKWKRIMGTIEFAIMIVLFGWVDISTKDTPQTIIRMKKRQRWVTHTQHEGLQMLVFLCTFHSIIYVCRCLDNPSNGRKINIFRKQDLKKQQQQQQCLQCIEFRMEMCWQFFAKQLNYVSRLSLQFIYTISNKSKFLHFKWIDFWANVFWHERN